MTVTTIPARRVAPCCPRCRGRLLHESDRHGRYLSCLSCGWVLEETTGHQAAQEDMDRSGWWAAQSA